MLGTRLIQWVFMTLLLIIGYTGGYNKAKMEVKQIEEKYQHEITNVHMDKQRELDSISRKYQQELEALKVSTDDTISKLSSDNKRLYVRVKSNSCTSNNSHRPKSTYRAELDEATVRKLITITKRGDAWIKALQDSLKEKNNYERTK